MAWYRLAFVAWSGSWNREGVGGGGAGEHLTRDRPRVSHALGKEVGGLALLWALFCLPQGRF